MDIESDVVNFESKNRKFESLMQFKVRHILLVSSSYDSFVLEEDGRLTDLIYNEYSELNLTVTPFVKRAPNAKAAMAILEEQEIDLVIIFKRVADIDVTAFGCAVKKLRPRLPVILLAYHERDLAMLNPEALGNAVDWVFIWTGDVNILLSMIKLVEDHVNVDSDTKLVGVRVIVLVEDSVRFYSQYLPLLYTEIMQQTQALMAEGLNVTDKLLRMRARPKILLATNHEQAWTLLTRYRKYLLGLISDISFEREGREDRQAGLKLIEQIRNEHLDLPIMLQSSNAKASESAAAVGVDFVRKFSPTLHADLRSFIMTRFGFGDFVFRLPDGSQVATAGDYRTMERCLETVPEESIIYHGRRNHFSNWLMARTEFDLAARLRPKKVSEFQSGRDLRRYLIQALRHFRHERQMGIVTDFSRGQFDLQSDFVRIGGGSLGGKGRGLAFINSLLSSHEIAEYVQSVRIKVPFSAVVGTDVFDAFMERNNLLAFALSEENDAEIYRRFLIAPLASAVVADLDVMLQTVTCPLAVRSSSMLEDSHREPFAGIYETHMLANNHPDRRIRLQQLETAIKLVYASTFSSNAKAYHEKCASRVEEEKMAVILQRAVGNRHGDYFYPNISGVAVSYNYYSFEDIHPEDGVAHVALGLGKTVVDGMNCLRFSPSHPQKLWQCATVEDILNNSQHDLYAIDMTTSGAFPEPGGEVHLVRIPVSAAAAHGTLDYVCSTYSPEDDRIITGTGRPGIRVVTFAPVLKGGVFPLANLLKFLMFVGSQGLNCPIEMEYAVNLETGRDEPKEFYFLQIRPMVQESQTEAVSLDDVDAGQAVILSDRALGNMRINYIRDILLVTPETFARSETVDIASELAYLNAKLRREHCPYLLIGPGRWGTSERWLGIPVDWNAISTAKVIIEAAYGDFAPEPSFGTHFFQNLTSFQVGYFTVNPASANGSIRWDWLKECPVAEQTRHVTHLRLEAPVEVRIDGRTGRGVVLARRV